MPEYKLYLLDSQNQVCKRIDMDCREDGHAVKLVSVYITHTSMELWQGERLVKRFERQEP